MNGDDVMTFSEESRIDPGSTRYRQLNSVCAMLKP